MPEQLPGPNAHLELQLQGLCRGMDSPCLFSIPTASVANAAGTDRAPGNKKWRCPRDRGADPCALEVGEPGV